MSDLQVIVGPMLSSAVGWSALHGHVKRINFLCKLLNVTEMQIQAQPGNCSSFSVRISVSDKYKRGFNLIQMN